ncbi:MAG: hypothetical protein IJ480_01160 [Clostridia bacterium]|nr:hypothetical protein [Clostridia bacterium]
MKNEKIRALFDTLSPDGEQKERMMGKILCGERKKTGRHLPMKPILAAAMVLVLSIGVMAVSPTLRQYFFPGLGLVTTDETQPLYLMLDPASDGGEYSCLYGYWLDGTAQFWIETEQDYKAQTAEDLLKGRNGEVFLESVHWDSLSDRQTGTYRVTVPELTASEAEDGVDFAGGRVRFLGMPALYHPYVKEENGLRLTLIPLAEDLTAFAADLCYLDGRDNGMTLHTRYTYDSPVDGQYISAMMLRDENGNTYPLVRIGQSSIYTLENKPDAPVTAFVSEMLEFSVYADDPADGTTVSVPVPEDGEMLETDLTFTFPDGVTEGKILAVGHSNPVYGTISEADFPMGYLTVVTDASEQDGIRYWYHPVYGEAYDSFLQPYLVTEVRSPEEVDPMEPMVPRLQIGRVEREYKLQSTQHYISDEKDTVELWIDGYRAAVPGDWTIEFNAG